MRIIYFSMLLLFAALSLQAGPYTMAPEGDSDVKGLITGKVVEASSGSPVEYATISLYTAADSVLVDGLISAADGTFTFKKVPEGSYNVIVRFMGFRNVIIKGVVITRDQQETHIGEIKLRPDVTNLEEVEIKGEKPLVEYKIDRKVVNVDQQINAKGGTAVDVLENIPSIQTDLDGNVELRGSSNFLVLIDGKPSIITGSDALNQIPAASIDKIEIITNPSAKYDPDGTAGIINVITKKNSLQGFSGIVNLSAGSDPEYSGDLLLNYRNKNTSISLGANYSDGDAKHYGTGYRETYSEDTTSYLSYNTTGSHPRKSTTLKAGIDQTLTDQNTLTGEISYRMYNRGGTHETQNQVWTSLDDSVSNYLTNDSGDSYHPTLQFTLRDVQKFLQEGSELSLQLVYDAGDDTDDDQTIQYLTDADWAEVGDIIMNYRRKTIEKEKEWRGDADLKYTFNDASILEGGAQLRLESNEITDDYYNRDSLDTEWILSDAESNRYNFYDNIYALYGTYAREFENLGLKVGLRAEYTDRSLDQITGSEKYPYQSFDLYPSGYLTYYLPYNQQVQMSYSKRVNRPRSFMLNPFTYFQDAFNSFQGNPDLKPEFAHSAELNYQKNFGNSFLSVESYYRLTKNKMTRVQYVNSEGTRVMTMGNLDKDQSLGVEMMGNVTATKWLVLVPSFSVYDYRLFPADSSTSEARQSTNWNARIDISGNFNSGTRIRLNGMYNSPTVTVDGTREGVFYAGFAIRQDFFKDAASVTLNINDIFDSRRMKGTSEGSNYYSYDERWRKAPVFTLTLTYKWNNFRSRRDQFGDDFNGNSDVINMNYF